MSDFALGDRVAFRRFLFRTQRYDVNNAGTRLRVKRWDPLAMPGLTETEMETGLVMGRRTLSNGEVRAGYSDEPAQYMGRHYFRAYLVAYDLLRNPVLVLPDDLTAVD